MFNKTLHNMRLLANGAAAFERAVIGGTVLTSAVSTQRLWGS